VIDAARDEAIGIAKTVHVLQDRSVIEQVRRLQLGQCRHALEHEQRILRVTGM
jgi:hypothetical protein